MGQQVALTVPRHIPPAELVEAVDGLPLCRGARFIETRLGDARSEDFSLHGKIRLTDTDGPAPREISFHHGRGLGEADGGGGGPYTYLTLGSCGNAERIICGLAAVFGGAVEDEATGRTWDFPLQAQKS